MERKNDLLELKNAPMKFAIEEKIATTREKLQLTRHAQWTKEAMMWSKLGNDVQAKELLQMILDDRKN